MNALEVAITNGRANIFDVYHETDNGKDSVKLFYMAGETAKPFVLICPGGGYEALCHLKDGFPVAAAFNKLDLSCVYIELSHHRAWLISKTSGGHSKRSSIHSRTLCETKY